MEEIAVLIGDVKTKPLVVIWLKYNCLTENKFSFDNFLSIFKQCSMHLILISIFHIMPNSMVRVASFGQILFFSTLERGAFLHTFLQLYTKYTLIIGSFTKKYIFGLFSENFHYFSNYGKKFMIFSQYTLSSSSCKSHLGKPTDKSWGCFEITLDRSFHSCKLHHL